MVTKSFQTGNRLFGRYRLLHKDRLNYNRSHSHLNLLLILTSEELVNSTGQIDYSNFGLVQNWLFDCHEHSLDRENPHINFHNCFRRNFHLKILRPGLLPQEKKIIWCYN